MFGNFLYYIVALLVFTTYQPAESPVLSALETMGYGLALFGVFAASARVTMNRLMGRIGAESRQRLDMLFQRAQNRLFILALIVFSIDIYGLNLPDHLLALPVLDSFPTLRGLLLLALFTAYLAVVWSSSHGLYRALHQSRISRKSYIRSNLAFSVPILLPWLLLSGIADMISLLPSSTLKAFLDTPEGQILYFLVFLVSAAVFGPLLIQKFWGCRPLGAGEHRARIEKLLDRAGLACKDILYWPIFEGRMITAGVMGLVRHFRYILVTEALLKTLSPDEVDAVIAHEIGHIKQNHLLFYLFFFAGYMLLFYALFEFVVLAAVLSTPVYTLINDSGFSSQTVVSALTTIATVLLFLVYFRYVLGYFMRNFERQADCFVYRLFPNARPLISTFEKIILSSGQSPDRPNWHHFSISERVGYLLRCEQDRSWIRRQDLKIKQSIGVYVLAIGLIGMVGYGVNRSGLGTSLSSGFFENVIREELARNPDDPKLHGYLGDIQLNREDYAGAIASYSEAIRLFPDDPHTLNNLAWLLATCKDPSRRDPRRALELAQRAAALSGAAYILDTLAESYFVNGQHHAAIAAAEAALEKADGDKAYYESQIRRFRESLFQNNDKAP